mmetsp:Transcript_134438/g.335358  ORF Transcript_134438/g.335358 Transcript_134438/m.335358 type:complete len:226 (+) Transcript_134438:188-865(+)
MQETQRSWHLRRGGGSAAAAAARAAGRDPEASEGQAAADEHDLASVRQRLPPDQRGDRHQVHEHPRKDSDRHERYGGRPLRAHELCSASWRGIRIARTLTCRRRRQLQGWPMAPGRCGGKPQSRKKDLVPQLPSPVSTPLPDRRQQLVLTSVGCSSHRVMLRFELDVLYASQQFLELIPLRAAKAATAATAGLCPPPIGGGHIELVQQAVVPHDGIGVRRREAGL